MNLLLDTHIAFWLASDHASLRAGELAAIMDPDNDIAVSAVSIWELQIKWDRRYRSGARKGPADPLALLTALTRMNIPVMGLTADQSATTLRDPIEHNDPFDELLLTIAQETGRKLLTRDRTLRGHPLALHAE